MAAVLAFAAAAHAQPPSAQAAPALEPPPAQAATQPPPTTELKVSGRVKLVGFYDFGGLQGQDGFKLPEIDTSDNRNEDDRLSADLKQTRLRLDAVRRGTRLGDVSAVVEADFRGSGGVNLRLRHAFVKVRGVTIGQTRSVLGDPDADADVIDLEGPPTGVGLRIPQFRFTSSPDRRWRWTIAAEVSAQDYSTLPAFDPDVVSTHLRWPDLTGSLRFGGSRGHVQVAGVVREIRYRRRPGGSSDETESESLAGRRRGGVGQCRAVVA